MHEYVAKNYQEEKKCIWEAYETVFDLSRHRRCVWAHTPELNWSMWGSLHDKKRNALDIQRAKQIIICLQENDAEGTAVAVGDDDMLLF
jgi:hypothetical protein